MIAMCCYLSTTEMSFLSERVLGEKLFKKGLTRRISGPMPCAHHCLISQRQIVGNLIGFTKFITELQARRGRIEMCHVCRQCKELCS